MGTRTSSLNCAVLVISVGIVVVVLMVAESKERWLFKLASEARITNRNEIGDQESRVGIY